MSPIQVEVSLCSGASPNSSSEFFQPSQDENLDPLPRKELPKGVIGESLDLQICSSSSTNDNLKCSPSNGKTFVTVRESVARSRSNKFFFGSSEILDRDDAGNDYDDDLTSLAWLQDANLLRNMAPCPKSTVDPRSFAEPTNCGIDDDATDCCSNDSFDSFREGTNLRDDFPRKTKKPQLSFSSLIFLAIENSAEKSLPVKSIYDWITKNFPYFKDARPGWKNSIRHNLSFNRYFKNSTCTERNTKRKASRWSVDPRYRHVLQQSLIRRNPRQNDLVFCNGRRKQFSLEVNSNLSDGDECNVDLDVASTLANLSSLIGQKAGQPILTACPVPGDQTRNVWTGISIPDSEGLFADIGRDNHVTLPSPSSSSPSLLQLQPSEKQQMKSEFLCKPVERKEPSLDGISPGPSIGQFPNSGHDPDGAKVLNDKTRILEGINALLGLACAVE